MFSQTPQICSGQRHRAVARVPDRAMMGQFPGESRPRGNGSAVFSTAASC